MNRSEQINELVAALSAAQGEIEGAVKGKINPAFRSQYADLGAVWDAIRAPLSKAGLALIQALEATDGGVACETMLAHKSGQWISNRFEVPVGKHDAQGYGSAATYVRRYSAMALVGLAPIDDDGEAAVGRGKAQQAPQLSAVPATDYSVQKAALEACGTIAALHDAWKAFSAAERRALSAVKDQVKARIEMADAGAANA